MKDESAISYGETAHIGECAHCRAEIGLYRRSITEGRDVMRCDQYARRKCGVTRNGRYVRYAAEVCALPPREVQNEGEV
jgi:hypothetical protein